MSKIKYITLIIAFTLVSGMVSAQDGGYAGAANRLGFGPKGMAMSNAMTAVTSQGSFAFYNPALAASEVRQKQFHLGAASMKFDRIHQTLSASFPLPPDAGLSVGLIRSGVNNIDGRTASGYPTGNFDTSEYQLFGAFAKSLSQNLKGGVAFKLNYLRLHQDLKPSTSIGIDFGLLYKASERLNIGLAVQDLLSEYSFNSADLYGLNQARNVTNKFPTRIKAGLAYQINNFTFSGEYELRVMNSEYLVTETIIDSWGNPRPFNTVKEAVHNAKAFRLGGAWDTHERFTLRAGYTLPDASTMNSSGFTGGFSIYLPFDRLSPSIDYAFVTEPYRVASMHIFALSLHL